MTGKGLAWRDGGVGEIGFGVTVVVGVACSSPMKPASLAMVGERWDSTSEITSLAACSIALVSCSRVSLARYRRLRQRSEQVRASDLPRNTRSQDKHILVFWRAIFFVNFFVRSCDYDYGFTTGQSQGENVGLLRSYLSHLDS